MSIAWPSLREVRGHLQTLLCLSFCWLPLEGTAWDWAKLDLLSEFLFFCSILAAFFSCQLRRFSFDDYIDNISSSMLERLCSKLWPHLCRRPCVTWVSDNAGGQKLVFRQQILQEDVLWEAWHVEATSWQPKVQISALIQDNVDELDRLARTSLCVIQGLEFGCGKCCWFRLPSEDLTWIHVQNKRKRLRMGQQGGCKDADDGASDDPVKFWWCWWWWWWWQRWWGRSWQIPVMLIKSQSDDIGLYGFKIIILQVLVITRELSCSFLKSFRVGYWIMFGAGSRGCAQVQLRSIEHVRKCNCVHDSACHCTPPHPPPPPHPRLRDVCKVCKVCKPFFWVLHTGAWWRGGELLLGKGVNPQKSPSPHKTQMNMTN